MIRYSVHRLSRIDANNDYHLFEIEIPDSANHNENDTSYTNSLINKNYAKYSADKFIIKKIINLRYGTECDKFAEYEKNKLYENEYGWISYFVSYNIAISTIPFKILQTYNMKNCFCDSFVGEFNSYDNTYITDNFYHNNGIIEGMYKIYLFNKIKLTLEFVNGKLNGLFRDYDFNGNIIKEYIFSNGKIMNEDSEYSLLYKSYLSDYGFI